MNKNFTFLLLSIFLGISTLAKVPLSQNFSEKDYHTHPIIWHISDDTKGQLWMANNEGVLRFNGSNWSLIPTPKPVRNLAFDKKGNVFIACEGDIAVLQLNKLNQYEYYSFKEQLGNSKEKSLGNKMVFSVNGKIHFLSGENVFVVNENATGFEIKIIKTGEISGAFVIADKLYINLLRKGLGTFANNNWQAVSQGDKLIGKTVVGATAVKNEILIGTNFDGCFILNQKGIRPAAASALQAYALKGLYAVSSNASGDIALGSISNGVHVYGADLNLKESLVLPSEEIYEVFFDHENNLWTAHRKGLSHHKLSVPIWYYPEFEINGYITDLLVPEPNHLLVASTTGMFSGSSIQNPVFGKYANLNAECWAINKQYIATTNGLYTIDGKPLIQNEVFVYLQTGNKNKDNTYAFGPEAAYLINKQGVKKIEGIDYLVNSVFENEDGSLWIGSNHNGLLKINGGNFDPTKLPEELRDIEVNIKSLNGNPVFYSKKGAFIWAKNGFEKSENLSNLLEGKTNPNFELTENFWSIKNNDLLWVQNEKQKECSYAYLLNGKASAFCQSGQELWVALEEKIVQVSLQEPGKNEYTCLINRISNSKGIILYESNSETDVITPTFDYENNSICIEFGINSYLNTNKNKFRYKLDGDRNGFSGWQSEGKLNLNNLNPGKYTLEIEAQNALGNQAKTLQFSFSIKAPWYLSVYAYLVYACMLILIIYWIIWMNSKALITKNQKLERIVSERTQQLEKNNLELKSEKKKSDDLLLNILPEEIAEELKSTGRSEARLYNHVTVLFTDFVGFTSISEQLSPRELVSEIHKNFTAFDAIMEKHGLEKIKTIGDAYLAVCGMPIETENHAGKVLEAALEIQQYILQSESKFKVRIGINSGPVVAGIVGVKKYAYDIWGDTVNTAARMEQNSIAGKINISQETFDLVQNHFDCEYRGKINAKNKGDVNMYFVNAKKA